MTSGVKNGRSRKWAAPLTLQTNTSNLAPRRVRQSWIGSGGKKARRSSIRIPSVFVPRHGSALVPQKAAASPLCDAVPRLPGHAVHGHVQHVFQRLPVSGPLPDAGARPSDDLDRRRLLFSHRETSRRVEARLLPSDTPAWNDLAGTVPHQLHRISDSGLLCIKNL